MARFRWLSCLLLVMLMISVTPVGAQAPYENDAPVPAADPVLSDWYIVQFEDPPLVDFARSQVDQRMMSAEGKLSVQTVTSQAYITQLRGQQALFKMDLARALPGAHVEHDFQVVLNAVSVQLPDPSPEAIRALMQMPGVESVSPQIIYTVDMDYSLPLINAPDLWTALGGQDAAGEGVKVAIIDTGIDPSHPMFDGTDFDYPATGTWPKGDCATVPGFCNGKIIAANAYAPTIPVHEDEFLTPMDANGHGTHVAGTAAGNRISATYGADTQEVSGVAPGAWLMIYKGLYNTPQSLGSGSNIMLAAAVEDAVAQGADVINNSWGSSMIINPLDDPLQAAYEAAVDAGVVVVFSAGNAGPGYNTVGSPTSPKFIEVGASTTSRGFYNTVSVTAPDPVSDTLKSIPGNQFEDLAPTSIPTGTLDPLPYIPCDLLGNPDLTLAGVTAGITETAPYTGGWIALIPRGEHNFTVKLDNAIAHGASAAIMYTTAGSTWKGLFNAGGRDIFTVMIAHDLGLGMRSWWETYTETAKVQIGYPMVAMPVDTQNVIADFSSRGPGAHLLIKPDVVAPGVSILSAQPNGAYASYGGTSMSSPHVTGAAALLLAAHPDWTPAQVKSALMSTGDQVIFDLDEVSPADLMTQGAGLIDLSEAADPGLFFDRPSVSFGAIDVGDTRSVVIHAQEVSGAGETYDLTVSEWITATGVTVTLNTAAMAMKPNGSAAFTLTVEADPTATPVDVEGNVILSGTTHLLHIPYWVRVTPATTAEVLLVDFDADATPLADVYSWGDYQSYYTQTLTNLGVTYDVCDTETAALPTRAVLEEYDKVIVFTGDNSKYSFESLSYEVLGDASLLDDFRSYLALGGKLLITGQDALGLDGLNPYMRGAADLPLVNGTYPMAVGLGDFNPFLKGMIFDAYPGGGRDGANNQVYVDELMWVDYIDLDTKPLFETLNIADPVADGIVGTRSSYEPTIERVQNPLTVEPVSWRVAFLGFGLEGVNNNTGGNTREDLMGALLAWMDDEVTVAFDQTSYRAAKPLEFVEFTATMSATIGIDDIYYRWDFGDGSDIEVTTTPTAMHQYQQMGYYTAYVEVMDEFAHKAVAEPVPVEVGSHLYLPVVVK